MTRDEGKRLRRLFAEAVELPPDRRARFLEDLSGPDVAIRAELELLLIADAGAAYGLPRSGEPRSSAAEPVPDRIGPYRVTGVLGEGGMGVVYSAGPVAVKLLRRELVCSTTVARFNAERDALSVMDHPNVARVFESGTTGDGRLFIAMESVPGTPIHAFCDERRLDIEARLDLFLQVCDGVQHAHERGVIHRDLSPGNVLVAVIDGRPRAKIIDFGIAKFVEPGPRTTPRTEAGVLIGTPEYLSPEQLALRPGAGDTRTDVWALGLMLYEMLAGALPYDEQRLALEGLEGLRAMVGSPLPTPRERLRGLPVERAETIARARATDRRALLRRVTGDLGRIAMKALARDRAMRYPSPNDLADDVRRHLRLEPVEAGPPGVVYRLDRFVRRRARSLAAAGVLIAVVGPVTVSAAIQSQRASAAAERAKREASIAKELADFVLSYMVTPANELPRVDQVDPGVLLDRGAQRALESFELTPVLRARLLHGFGEAQRRFGRLNAAAKPLEEALRTFDGTLGPESAEALAAGDSLARLRQDQHEFDEAIRLYRHNWETRVAAHGEDDLDAIRAAGRLGLCLNNAKRFDEAEPLFARCVEGMRRRLGDDSPETLVVESYWIGVLGERGRSTEELEVCERALPLARAVLGVRHPESRAIAYNRACALGRLGRRDEAVDALSDLVDDGFPAEGWMLEDPDLNPLRGDPRLAGVLERARFNTPNGLPLFHVIELRAQGHLRQSEEILRRLIEADARTRPEGDMPPIDNRYTLADVVFLQGRFDEAETLVSRLDADNLSLKLMDRPYPDTEFIVFRAQCRLGKGDIAGAKADLDEAAARTTPRSAVAAYVASRRAALDGDRAGAARWLREAESRGCDFSWWLDRDALAARRAGRLDEAAWLAAFNAAWARRWGAAVANVER